MPAVLLIVTAAPCFDGLALLLNLTLLPSIPSLCFSLSRHCQIVIFFSLSHLMAIPLLNFVYISKYIVYV